jgi:hypothetical protein
MILLFSGSDVDNRLVGAEDSKERQDLFAQFQNTCGSGFESVIYVRPGLPIKLLRQQWAGRPFPAALQAQNLARPFYQAQFQSQLLDLKPNVIVLSIEPDLRLPLWRHKAEGFLFCPESDVNQQWLQDEFEPLGLTTPDAYEADLLALVEEIKVGLGAAVLILNGSTVDPADDVYSYNGRQTTLPVQINRFNLALLRVSMQRGISIIDVDRLAAEAGDPHITALLQYSENLTDIIRQEIVRIIDDLDLGHNDQPLYKLEMPYVDLTIREGVVAAWYKAVGDPVKFGDKLVDLEVEFEKIKRTTNAQILSRKKTQQIRAKRTKLIRRKWQRALVQLISGGEGYLQQIYSQPNSAVQQGTLMAAITAENIELTGKPPMDITTAAKFKVSAQKLSIEKDS